MALQGVSLISGTLRQGLLKWRQLSWTAMVRSVSGCLQTSGAFRYSTALSPPLAAAAPGGH